MGPEAVAADPAQALALAQERLPFEGMDHTALIDRFVETDCRDQVVGRELGMRLMEHAGVADAATTPLVWTTGEHAGQQINDLTLADYVNFAASHHPYAVGEILELLELDPTRDAEEYAAMRDAMLERLTSSKA